MEKFARELAGCNVGGGDVFGFKVLPIDGVWPSEIDFGDVEFGNPVRSVCLLKNHGRHDLE